MNNTEQLEFFELPRQQAPRRRSQGPIGNLQLRHDHAVLMAILSLMGVSVVFAMGVERGKLIARLDRPLLIPTATANAGPAQAPVMHASTKPPSTPATPVASEERRPSASTRKREPAPKATTPELRQVPRKAEKSLAKAGQSRFAVQIVTFSQPKRAHRELQRLKQQGEPAFLVMKQGKTALLVGPFVDRANATAKLATLKPRYQDCFLRSL